MKIKQAIKKFTTSIASLFHYQPNDPTTPILVKHTSVPPLPNPCPPFAVQGWNGMGAPAGSLQAQAAGVYITMATSLNFVNRMLDLPVGNWSGTHNLIAIPRAGMQFNAYYDRSTLRFFHNAHPKTGKMVYTCESADIVSHELWHGILDSLRPDIWGVQNLEIFAFHESFGDMGAILTALCHEEIIDYVIRETGGDLKHNNIVARLAEEMGAALFALTGGIGGRPADALRNAINEFTYVPPETLPNNTPDNQLSAECHNFSRVFTGGFYDMITLLYQQNLKSMNPNQALATSRDMAAKVLLNATRTAHNTPRFFDAVVRSMLLTDQNYGGGCQNAIRQAFTHRRILLEVPMVTKPTSIKMGSNKNCRTNNYKNGASTVCIGGTKTMKLIDNIIGAQATANPLYAVSVEVPNDHYLEYDATGHLKYEIPIEKKLVIETTKKCLDHLKELDKVSFNADAEDKEFKVAEDKLVRNHFTCC